jgi:hypothetical protein
VAFHIIGGGEESDKKLVRIKEQADHSLPYMVFERSISSLYAMPYPHLPKK